MAQAPVKATVTATTLTVSWNCKNFAMESYTFRPHMTALTIEVKLSSVRMISEASFATSVPAIPWKNATKHYACSTRERGGEKSNLNWPSRNQRRLFWAQDHRWCRRQWRPQLPWSRRDETRWCLSPTCTCPSVNFERVRATLAILCPVGAAVLRRLRRVSCNK